MGDDNSLMLQPGQEIKPKVTNEDVHRLVRKFYNLEVTSIKELNSYDDKNFFIKVKDDSCLPDASDRCPHGYLLKILNSLDSKAETLIDAQNQMMLFLNKRGVLCSKPVQNVEKQLKAYTELAAGKDKNIIRLLTYIPGDILVSVDYTPDLLFQIGEMVAKTDLALMDFHHEGIVGVERIWNLNSVPKVKEFVHAVTDETRRALSVKVIENFEKVVVPEYHQLLSGAIHGDLNEQNILVREDDSEAGKFNFAGIIDFGDIHRNFLVFELAITICYTMIDCKTMDVLDAPGHVLAGYNRWRPIPEKEFELLKSCIAARFSQSLVLGAYSYSQNPDPYVLTTAKRGWPCLEKFWDCPQDVLYKRWHAVMATYSNLD